MTKKPQQAVIATASPDTYKEKEEMAKRMLQKYVLEEFVDDFTLAPETIKLTLAQKTPVQFIKDRDIGGGKIYHYIDHQYSKKILNYIFNFNVSNEVVREEYFSYIEEYKDYKDAKCTKDAKGRTIPIKKTREVTEAECTVKFTFLTLKGAEIVRTVHSSHKGFKNPATTRGDIMQSALSKAWTKVAQTFGIGAELEDDLYAASKPAKKDEDEDIIDGEVVENDPTEKAFNKW